MWTFLSVLNIFADSQQFVKESKAFSMILNEVTVLEDLPECPKYFFLQKRLQLNVYVYVWKGQKKRKSWKKLFIPSEKREKKESKRKKIFSQLPGIEPGPPA